MGDAQEDNDDGEFSDQSPHSTPSIHHEEEGEDDDEAARDDAEREAAGGMDDGDKAQRAEKRPRQEEEERSDNEGEEGERDRRRRRGAGGGDNDEEDGDGGEDEEDALINEALRQARRGNGEDDGAGEGGDEDEDDDDAAAFAGGGPRGWDARNSAHGRLLREDVTKRFECTPREVLHFPQEHMVPLRMCCVSMGMVCLPSLALAPPSCELVFVQMGEAFSDHFQRVVWLFTYLNRQPTLDGHVVEVEGRTSLAYATLPGRKNPSIVGVKELFDLETASTGGGGAGAGVPEFYDNWPKSGRAIRSFSEYCRGEKAKEQTHVSKPPVRMHLGIIPIEYETTDGEKVREVAHVLRVTAVEGFHLLQFIEERFISRQFTQDRNSGGEVQQWCETWRRVLDFEMSENLLSSGLNGSFDAYSTRSMFGVGSPCHILSPFNVFEKILNNLKGGYCGAERKKEVGIAPGTLVVWGYPRVDDGGDDWVDFVEHMRELDSAYRHAMQDWSRQFRRILAMSGVDHQQEGGPNEDGAAERGRGRKGGGGGGRDKGGGMTVNVPKGNLRSFLRDDCVWPSLNIEISMRFIAQNASRYETMPRIMYPRLAILLIGWYMSASEQTSGGLLTGCSMEDYIRPHLENDMQTATQTAIRNKYDMMAEKTADMACAGMYSGVRQILNTQLETMRRTNATTLQALAQTYLDYIGRNLVNNEQVQLMNVYNSSRVYTTAQIIQWLSKKNNLCLKVAAGLDFAAERVTDDRSAIEQRVLPFGEMISFFEFHSAILLFNETARMNALNLSMFAALFESSVLMFLGVHNKTFIWKQFAIWPMGGAGSLRDKDIIYTMKRNSSGNGLVLQAWNYALRSIALIYEVEFCGLSNKAEMLSVHKVARATGAQIESMAAVVKVANQIATVPDADINMREQVYDEFNRNLNEDGVNAFITHYPRDSNSSAVVHKTAEMQKNKPIREKTTVEHLKGMGLMAIALSTNANKRELTEQYKSLAIVTHTCSPGAPPLGGETEIFSSQSKYSARLNQGGRDSASEGVSTDPTDPDTIQHLAYVLGMVPATARSLALMNKSGVLDFEIPDPSLLVFNAFTTFATANLGFIISSTMCADMHRIMQGYLSRGVGLSMLLTTLRHVRNTENGYREACRRIQMDMESSAMSLQLTHTAILSGFTRMLDCNVVWVNVIVGRIVGAMTSDGGRSGGRFAAPQDAAGTAGPAAPGLSTPVLDFDWLCDFLSGRLAGYLSPDDPNVAALRAFLLSHRFQGNYMHVPALAERSTYRRIETYMEKYLSVVKDSFQTYLNMVMESSAKRLNLEMLLNMSRPILLQDICARLGVPYDNPLNPDHEINTDDTFLYLQMDRGVRETVREAYVHVPSHLWLLALQGTGSLHSENMSHLASRLYEWFLRTFMPPQCVPAGVVFANSFVSGATVTPQVCAPDRSWIAEDESKSHLDYSRTDYIMRGIRDEKAFENGQISEFPPLLPPYMPEDTMHMGAQAQQWRIVTHEEHAFPFAPLPLVSPRSPELMPTRIYPAFSRGGDQGIVCVCPNGMNMTLLLIGEERLCLGLDAWQDALYENGVSVGPLIHRENALVVLPKSAETGDNGILGLIVPRSDESAFEGVQFADLSCMEESIHTRLRIPYAPRYFMDAMGMYHVRDRDGATHSVHYRDITLVQVGKHTAVMIRAVEAAIGGGYVVRKQASGNVYVRGSLRYPDECDPGPSDPHKVYFMFKSSTGACRVVGVPLESCEAITPEVARSMQMHI